MRIQHNITAMNSYRNFSANNSALSKNLEKLSSGYNINRAGDDAAGLAISEKMRVQISGLEGAKKNAKDGISLIQTAEGALTETHDMLNRMVTLAEQSANGTYQNELDREQLQKEVESLKSEIDRIADSTNFNGLKLLDGSLGGGVISNTGTVALGADISDFSNAKMTGSAAGGADLSGTTNLKVSKDYFDVDGQTLTIDWKDDTEAKGVYAKLNKDYSTNNITADEGKELAADLTDLFNQKMNEQGIGGTVKVSYDSSSKKFSIESVNESASGSIGWTGNNLAVADSAKSLGTILFSTTAGTAETVEAGKTFANSTAANDEFTMTINGTTVTATVASALTGSSTLANVATAVETAVQGAVTAYNTAMGYGSGDVNALTSTDFTVASDKSGGLKVTYGGDQDVSFSFGEQLDATTGKAGKTAAKLGLADASSLKGGARGLTLQIGDTSDSFNKLTVSVGDMHAKAIGIGNLDISTQEGASKAIDQIKNAVNIVSDTRGTLGALQNRLDHTINNIGVMTENIQSAESNIRDTDVAEEMMKYTKNSILNQSAQAMLAQANQLPQGVLQLLG